MRRMRRVVAIAGVLAATALTGVAPAGAGSENARATAQAPGPTITVDPASGLVDGDIVAVSGAGFVSGTWIDVAQCPAGAPSFESCALGNSSSAIVDAAGVFSVEVTLDARPALDGDTVDCRTAGACVMGATTDWSNLVTAPLGFAPDGPLLPPPTLQVTPSDGLVDGQVVTLTATDVRPPHAIALQCVAAPQSIFQDCDFESLVDVEVADDRTVSVDFAVSAIIATDTRGQVDCRQAPGCVVMLNSGYLGNGRHGATAPIAFDPTAPLRPPPTLQITPDQGLVDGQAVTATGSGYRADQYVGLLQCGPGLPSVESCSSAGYGFTDASGAFTTDLAVSARLVLPAGVVDCRTSPEPCVLVAAPGGNPASARAATAPIGFDPDGPLLPDPEVTVTPASELTDPATVSVQGSGYGASATVTVAQCQADSLVLCDQQSETWLQADESGHVDVSMEVVATFEAHDPGGAPTVVDCRQPPGCAIVARSPERGSVVTVPIAFGPPQPPRGRYLDPSYTDIDVTYDVVYRETTDYQGNPVALKMDIYRPAGDTATGRPVVMWMHGGYFIFGDKSDMAGHARDMARRGYVAISLEYRLRRGLSTSDIPGIVAASYDAYDDATAAVAWLRDHAADYGIDPDAVIAGGYSAGAVTSFNLAYLPGQLGPPTSQIAAALPIAGVSYGGVEAGEPPVMAFHGIEDTILPIENPRTICATARALGNVCELIEYAGVGHEVAYSRQRDIIRRATDFLAEHVLGPQGVLDPPTADAGDDTTVAEGDTVTLDASASVDPDGGELTYAWVPGGHLDDPTSPTPTYTTVDDSTETLTLTVTDARGITATDELTITTVNAAPQIDHVTGSAPPGGTTLVLDIGIADAGHADTHAVEVEWGDGVAERVAVEQGAGTAMAGATHVYAEPGEYAVTVTVSDDDGGTDTWNRTVVVGCTIVGTPGPDRLTGTRGGDVICGGDGDDTIDGGQGDDLVFGGDGDDTIHGGQGDDLVFGGDGDDTIHGGQGDDLVFGGDGDDTIHGEQGGDQLHGGDGDDTIHGGQGSDALWGDAGDDTLHGDAGADTIDGG
jgi:acetyl esterase/lipase